jgi:2,3-bisphosphoglycerate-independent phosphoglycerate mutase
MAPASDTANLSVLGYDPRRYYRGRSPFEAASLGIPMEKGDVSFRCNVVTLSAGGRYPEKKMLDYSAGGIPTEESRLLIEETARRLNTPEIKFYPGKSYRHLMIWRGGPRDWKLTPPHDISERVVGPYLPAGSHSSTLLDLMVESSRFLPDHPVNRGREERGLPPANSLWIWGEGTSSSLPLFAEKYGLKGAVISAVDLVMGLGRCAGLDPIAVEGATGDNNTNFIGKAQAALEALERGYDFVYIHLEAPDEYGHRNDVAEKVRAIELIDERVVKVVRSELDRKEESYSLMVLPDHATPLALRTHTADPVPFVIYRGGSPAADTGLTFDEAGAARTGIFVEEGHCLMDLFLGRA